MVSSWLRNPRLFKHAYACTVGTVAGFTVGLVGWGGAQVLIPAMTAPFPSFAGHSQLSATGISLSSLSVSTLTSGYWFWAEDRVVVPVALAISLPAVAAARAGSHLARRMSGEALALFYNGCSVVLIPTHFWIQKRAEARGNRQSRESTEGGGVDTTGRTTDATPMRWRAEASGDSATTPPPPTPALSPSLSEFSFESMPSSVLAKHVSFGIVSGILSSLMGVGGLPFAMSYLTEATRGDDEDDLPHHLIQGTAICSLLPAIIVSAVSRVGATPLGEAGCVALGALVGSYWGAEVALGMPPEKLRTLYVGSLFLFGGRSMVGALRNLQQIYRKSVR
ncbi:unnamed protein product [Pseudo-nitzschia multistriata]|uniref:Membrane transporter protein n=1 Tax=Pseudo-nitzschia multistriata TaxID=183589 RepID=A0A448ZQE9_9STRA|nr:unnamed protein product [Pseudo-nitzschia multistriata]